ncbi:MAG: hypothetical protein AAGM22_22240 [Acidobacteriota bacterium]
MEISEDFKRAYREATRRDDRASCPSPEELVALVDGTLPPERREAVLDHLAVDSDSALEVRLLMEAKAFFEQKADSETDPAASPSAPAPSAPIPMRATPRRRESEPRRRVAQWVALAATVLLAVGLGVTLQTPDETPVVRSASAAQVLPVEGAVLKAPPTRLEWEAVTGAESYGVTLFNSSGAVLWRSDPVDGPSSELPAEVVAELSPGDYLWTVKVQGATSRRELGPHAFTVGPGDNSGDP